MSYVAVLTYTIMSLGGVSSLWRVAGVPEEPGNGADGRSQAGRQDWGGRGEERCSDQRGNGRGAEDGFKVMLREVLFLLHVDVRSKRQWQRSR